MNLSIFGLGYVGTVSAACLARDGHRVIGVDINVDKVDLVNRGCSPIIEPGIADLISDSVKKGRLRAITNTLSAVLNSEIAIVCVGTPSYTNGSLSLEAVKNVCQEIGTALRDKLEFHVIVIRSTILPGIMRSLVIPTLESTSGKRAGVDFGACINPEFLREGSALFDYDNPPKIVIGSTCEKSVEILKILYGHLSAPWLVTDFEVAEMIKYVDNAWHAVKVSFANEIGILCKANDIDSHAVMDIFVQDTKLNLSPNYLRPGPAFGGSCLPKDVRALTYQGRILDLDLPLLNSILSSNLRHIDRTVKLIQDQGRKRIGILGLSFKTETDDLRESPMIAIAETLLGRGYDLKIFDRNVHLAGLVGANRDYILNVIPHIHRLMTDDMDELLEHAQTIVIGNQDKTFAQAMKKFRSDQKVVDLVRIHGIDQNCLHRDNYIGICW